MVDGQEAASYLKVEEDEEGLCWYFLAGAASQGSSSGLELELHVSKLDLLLEV